ncbi:MAG: hypothetical protein AB7Q01_08335 [Gammaproteobacteria bacterium]
MSALDLFASAMGAFVIICIILFPYYRKTLAALEKSAMLESQIVETREKIEQYKRETEVTRTTVSLEDLKKKRMESERELEVVQKKIKKVQDVIRNSVKFVFLGLRSDADVFTLVIDLSDSMNAYKALMLELTARIIGALNEEHSVMIVGFQITGQSPAISVWPESRRPLKMSSSGRKAAAEYTQKLAERFKGGTPTYDALLTALDLPGETIVLLTDGIPSFPDMSGEQILDLVSGANAGRRQIHTVGIGEFNKDERFTAFLEALASRNGGEFASYVR